MNNNSRRFGKSELSGSNKGKGDKDARYFSNGVKSYRASSADISDRRRFDKVRG